MKKKYIFMKAITGWEDVDGDVGGDVEVYHDGESTRILSYSSDRLWEELTLTGSGYINTGGVEPAKAMVLSEREDCRGWFFYDFIR
jgi:hypothetical protein